MATPPEHSERPLAPSTQPAASDAPAGTQGGTPADAGTDDAAQGSPAAPAMKQFQKTDTERGTGQ